MWSNFWKCGQNYRNLVKNPQEKEETFDNCAQCTLYIYYYSSLAVTLIWIYHQRATSPPLAEYCPWRQTEIFIIFFFDTWEYPPDSYRSWMSSCYSKMKSLKHWKLEANNSFSIFFVHVSSEIEDPFAIAVHFIGFHLGRNCNRCLIEDDHFQKSFSWSLIFFWLKWTKNLRHCSAKFARNSRI